MTDLLSSSQFWLLVSIGFYALGVEIQKKTGSAVCNPLLIASILVGALLIATGTPYQTYEESGKLISFFLTPATVALAIPIYRKLDVLLKNLLPILLGAFVGSMVSIGSVLLFSHLFGLSESTTLSLVPKSVTTPIAVAVAEMLGGVTSITAIAVVITGIIGAMQMFDVVMFISKGNPFGQTDVLMYRIYRDGFINFNLGMAGAESLVLGLVTIFFALGYLWLQKRSEDE